MSEGFTHRLRVRYSECDQQGVVFNGNYLFYLDVALTEWWRHEFGSYTVLLERGFDVVVAETTLRFRSGARFDEDLDITLTVRHLGNTSMTVAVTFTCGERLVADGEARYVFVGTHTTEKKPMDDELRATLQKYAAA